ncbi:MAG: bifunctional phosphoglucose/phosphomannose isomerase [Thermoleophilia bacterium]|nr:bifunctional phosphoglucose/phosphomannose isomerase [Thermoleophilia bacterium]
MTKLDDASLISSLDSQDQFGMVADLPEQVLRAYAAAGDVDIGGFDQVTGIAVAGMGGSAIGGDVIAVSYEDRLEYPMVTVRGYRLPGWIDDRTLVFVVSYSGNTEETISCLEDALNRGCRVICVATGGAIGRAAGEREIPLIVVPANLQPRAAMGWLSVPVAACLEKLGLLNDVERDADETAAVLGQLRDLYGPENPAAGNPAKLLAKELENRIPVIYGAELTATAAYRWKCQINENSKAMAFAHEFPELNHNEVVGWERPPERLGDYRVVYLKDGQSHSQNHKRMDITADLLETFVGGIREYVTSGKSRLARILSSTYLGDYVSLYLALLYGIDPSPVERIENLKKRLA